MISLTGLVGHGPAENLAVCKPIGAPKATAAACINMRL